MPDPDRVNVRTAVARIPEAERPEIRWYTEQIAPAGRRPRSTST